MTWQLVAIKLPRNHYCMTTARNNRHHRRYIHDTQVTLGQSSTLIVSNAHHKAAMIAMGDLIENLIDIF